MLLDKLKHSSPYEKNCIVLINLCLKSHTFTILKFDGRYKAVIKPLIKISGLSRPSKLSMAFGMHLYSLDREG